MHQRSTESQSHRRGISAPAQTTSLPSVPAGKDRKRQRGQAAVEAALTAAISVMTILATLQISLVAAQQFSAAHVARTTARWLAVRMDTTDAQVLTQAQTTAASLPGLTGGGMPSVTVLPSCAALTAGICSGRETGQAIKVTVNTSLSAVMFLPTSFGVAPFMFNLPTSMPAISYTVLLE